MDTTERDNLMLALYRLAKASGHKPPDRHITAYVAMTWMANILTVLVEAEMVRRKDGR